MDSHSFHLLYLIFTDFETKYVFSISRKLHFSYNHFRKRFNFYFQKYILLIDFVRKKKKSVDIYLNANVEPTELIFV